jgi:hypothetical protein
LRCRQMNKVALGFFEGLSKKMKGEWNSQKTPCPTHSTKIYRKKSLYARLVATRDGQNLYILKIHFLGEAFVLHILAILQYNMGLEILAGIKKNKNRVWSTVLWYF